MAVETLESLTEKYALLLERLNRLEKKVRRKEAPQPVKSKKQYMEEAHRYITNKYALKNAGKKKAA